MRFRQLDLNLLHALNVLIEEQSVSRAAHRLNVSQPTMSSILARLREFFRDPILIQQGRSMSPSPLTLELKPMLLEALAQVNSMIAASLGFDAAVSDRCFCISTSDLYALTIVADLIRASAAEAPGVSFEVVTSMEGFSRAGERSEVDLALLPAQFALSGQPAHFLFEEQYRIAGWNENPLVQTAMTEEQFYGAGHVGVTPAGRHYSISESFLRARGRARRVEVMASSFLYAPDVLIGTERLMIMPLSLARKMARRLPILHVEPPFPVPGYRVMLQHQASRGGDPGVRWLIERMMQCAEMAHLDIEIAKG